MWKRLLPASNWDINIKHHHCHLDWHQTNELIIHRFLQKTINSHLWFVKTQLCAVRSFWANTGDKSLCKYKHGNVKKRTRTTGWIYELQRSIGMRRCCELIYTNESESTWRNIGVGKGEAKITFRPAHLKMHVSCWIFFINISYLWQWYEIFNLGDFLPACRWRWVWSGVEKLLLGFKKAFNLWRK